MVNIAVLNQSTTLSDTEVQTAIPALQKQISGDFAPVWGADATLAFVAKGQAPDPTHWQLVLLDNSDQAGALGYHDLTPAGLPLSKVFTATDKQYGYNWTVTASHELLEMLGDPDIDLTVFTQDAHNQVTIYAYEACDACEADQFGYQIDGATVSDFVFPSWFTPGLPGPYDKMGHITAPLALLSGGYIGTWTPNAGWTQKQAEGEPGRYEARAPVGSRRERRRTPRHLWQRSAA